MKDGKQPPSLTKSEQEANQLKASRTMRGSVYPLIKTEAWPTTMIRNLRKLSSVGRRRSNLMDYPATCSKCIQISTSTPRHTCAAPPTSYGSIGMSRCIAVNSTISWIQKKASNTLRVSCLQATRMSTRFKSAERLNRVRWSTQIHIITAKRILLAAWWEMKWIKASSAWCSLRMRLCTNERKIYQKTWWSFWSLIKSREMQSWSIREKTLASFSTRSRD